MKKVVFGYFCVIFLLLSSMVFAQGLEVVETNPRYTYLSDISSLESEFPYFLNDDPDGEDIQLDSFVYKKGICMQTNSQIEFTLGKSYNEFNTVMGIGDKDFSYGGKLIFEVWADGEKIYETRPLATGEHEGAKLPIKKVKTLILKVKATTDEGTDFAVWANAHLR